MELLELAEDRAIANVPAGVRYGGAFPIRLRAVRNDGAGHRLQGSERYFAFPVIGLSEDSARPSPRTNEFWNQGNSGNIFSKSISDVALRARSRD